jgi:hypothetical protein
MMGEATCLQDGEQNAALKFTSLPTCTEQNASHRVHKARLCVQFSITKRLPGNVCKNIELSL